MSGKALRRLAGPALGVVAVAAAAALGATGALARVEAISWDARARALAEPAPSDLPVRVVLVDDASLASVASQQGVAWRWPREYFAAILAYLHEDGARAIVCDFDFIDHSPFGVEDDRRLHDTLAGMPGPVLPLRLKGEARSWPEPPPPIELSGNLRVESSPGATFSHADVVAGTGVSYGHVVSGADRDAIVRRVRAVYSFDGRPVPQLGLAAFLLAGEDTPPRLAVNEGRLGARGREVPLDEAGDLLLRYRRPDARSGHLYPAHAAAGILAEVSRGEAPKGIFRDCYVVFGASAENLFDSWPTPVRETVPGAEVHATVLDNLITGGFLRPAPDWLAPLLALAVCIAASTLVARARALAGSVAVAVIALPLPAAAATAAWARGIAVPVAWPTLAVALAVAGAGAFNWVSEGRQRRYLRHAFGHYLSPAVIARIVEDPSRLRLGGERRELSVFFADLEGFTALSEEMEPRELALFLNDYLDEMTRILLDEEGTLDKYQGDAIVAFWNAPSDQPDHALRAVRAALRCQRRLAELQPGFARRAGRTLRMRIGLHTGAAAVGNFGSRHRFDYTVLGDVPNLASRLEGANKHFGTGLLVSEATWGAVEHAVAARPLGRLRVVGRAAPVRVYEPLALGDEPAPPLLAAFREARRRCEAADWEDAARALEACGDDPAARVWLARVRELEKKGATAWDDLWTLASK